MTFSFDLNEHKSFSRKTAKTDDKKNFNFREIN